MSRYARQICLPEIGTAGQAKLAQASVLVVGAGGLGATVLPALAGAGCGSITIVDPDLVDETNLHRQTLFRMSDIGQPKAECAGQALLSLNPECRVHAMVTRLDPPLARELVPRADVVIDAADSFAVTYALSDICAAAGVPLISASVLGRSGYVGGFCATAPSYRAVFPDLPPSLQSCATAGVMGPVVAMLGAMQAQMALAVLLDHAPSPLGQVMRFDLAGWRASSFRFDGAAEPETASPAIVGLAEITAADLVVELRDEAEAPTLLVPGSRRLSPDLAGALDAADAARVIFVCKTGLRAWRAARQLAERQTVPVAILAEGA